MTASSVIEYYRQFAFVSSVLAGFAFSFYGVLLSASARHRAAKPGGPLGSDGLYCTFARYTRNDFRCGDRSQFAQQRQDAFIHCCATDAPFFLFSCWDCPFVWGLWSWGMDSVTLVGYRHDCYRRPGFGRCYSCPHTLPSLNRCYVKHLSRQ